jgi:hypothetical protein
MEILSFVALILLSLVGYSCGAVSRAGKSAELKPQALDLVLVLLLWTGAIYSRIATDVNRWLLILIGIMVAFVLGIISVQTRKLLQKESSVEHGFEIDVESNIIGNGSQSIWYRWKDFSQRMGSFQSRVILSFFFFLLVSPLALAVKLFSDPLRIKSSRGESHWHRREDMSSDLKNSRRQF